jgi:hypothetical protein
MASIGLLMITSAISLRATTPVLSLEPGGFQLAAPMLEEPGEARALPHHLPTAGGSGKPDEFGSGVRPDGSVLKDASPDPSGPKVLPWVTLGGSVVLGAVGVYFAVKTSDALDAMSIPTGLALTASQARTELQQEQSAVFHNALAASVFLSVGVAGLITSALLLLGQ